MKGAHANGKLTGALYCGGRHTLTVGVDLEGRQVTVAVALTEWQASYLSKRLAPSDTES